MKLLQVAISRSLFFGAESSSDSYSFRPNGIAWPTSSRSSSRVKTSPLEARVLGDHAHGLSLHEGAPRQHGEDACEREKTSGYHPACFHGNRKALPVYKRAHRFATHPSSVQVSASVSRPSTAAFFSSQTAIVPSSRILNPSAEVKRPSARTNR